MTRDLFGFIDVVALHPDCLGVIAVQATSATNLASHIDKIKQLEHDAARLWSRQGNPILLFGWAKKKTVSGAPRYRCRIAEMIAKPNDWLVIEHESVASGTKQLPFDYGGSTLEVDDEKEGSKQEDSDGG